MRRENRRKGIKEEGFDTKKMLLITGTILSLAVIAFVITFLIYGNTLNESQELARIDTNSLGTITAEETSTSQDKTVNEMEENIAIENNTENIIIGATEGEIVEETNKIAINTSSVEATEDEAKTQTNTKTEIKSETVKNETTKKTENTQKNETKTEEIKEEKIPDPEFITPVSGDIMKEFADNKLVYSSTLDVWTTHNGIDIVAEKTTVVKASADGTISSIKNDPRYGLTVIIEHVNGFKTVYSNLLSTEFVVEGEKVTKGQSIATVGNSAAFEISEEPHLHFELIKENQQLDPELYIK